MKKSLKDLLKKSEEGKDKKKQIENIVVFIIIVYNDGSWLLHGVGCLTPHFLFVSFLKCGLGGLF